jgi:hypothetical protein
LRQKPQARGDHHGHGLHEPHKTTVAQ